MREENLKQYMLDVKKLENDIYKMQGYSDYYKNLVNYGKDKILQIENRYGWKGNVPEKATIMTENEWKVDKLKSSAVTGIIIAVIAAVICWFVTHNSSYCGTTFVAGFLIVTGIGYFGDGDKSMNYGFYKGPYNERNASIDVYERCNNDIEKATTAIKQADPIALQKAKQKLSDLYAEEIIFGKYRNFIAVNQICEYLECGRCTELAGPYGAYNLFEMELKQNTIISKLDMILTELEQIKINQYNIYNAIRATNQAIAEMSLSVTVNTYIGA